MFRTFMIHCFSCDERFVFEVLTALNPFIFCPNCESRNLEILSEYQENENFENES